MKFLLVWAFFLFIGNSVSAQNEKPCGCSILKTVEKNYFPNEKEANKLLTKYISQVSAFSKIKTNTDPFVIKEAACPSPTSMICETVLANGRKQNVRLILYNNYFLKGLNKNESEITLVDKHVLLHELGHHVLGHHKVSRGISALNIPYERDTPDPKRWNKYGTDNPMAKEVEADIYAVWVLSKLEKGFTVDRFAQQLNSKAISSPDSQSIAANHSDHPLFSDRIRIMRKFEEEMNRKQMVLTLNYVADIASSAYLSLWPENYFYDVYVDVGTTLIAKTNFSVAGEKVNGFLYPLDQFSNYHLGLSVTRFRFDKPLQTEFELQYSRYKYGTSYETADGNRQIEKIQVNYFSFCPKVTWSSVGNAGRSLFRSLRFGFISSVGINARFPVGNVDYTNYLTAAPAPKTQFSIGPKVSLGLALVRKSFRPRGFKVLFSYDPLWIRLKTTPKPKVISHNLQFTLQCAIVRK